MPRPLIVANWKLHGGAGFTADLLAQLAVRLADVEGVDIVVCPPFVSLAQAREVLDGSGIMLGAQHVSDHRQGAYTGEVSAPMLREIGCDYVIVGHSERRCLYKEEDRSIARRFAQALATGLVPVLCVGETLAQREAGATDEVIGGQLAAISGEIASGRDWVVAYEPVWAIGTGRIPSTEQLAEAQASIRTRLRRLAAHEGVRVIYGGSITPANATALFAIDAVDGGLVGAASLDSESFCRIVQGIRPWAT